MKDKDIIKGTIEELFANDELEQETKDVLKDECYDDNNPDQMWVVGVSCLIIARASSTLSRVKH